MTRADIMDKLNIPKNNPGLVVTKSNIKGTGFLRTEYDEKYLKDYMDQKDYLKIIDRASKIMALEYSKKRKTDSKETPMTVRLSYLLATILLIAFGCLAYYMPHVD